MVLSLTRRWATTASGLCCRKFIWNDIGPVATYASRVRTKAAQLNLPELDEDGKKRWEATLKQGRERGWSDQATARYFRVAEQHSKQYILSKRVISGEDVTHQDAAILQTMDRGHIMQDPVQYIQDFPYRFKWSRPWSETVDQIFYNLANRFQNTIALYSLACENSLPGTDLSNSNFLDRYLTFPFSALRFYSTRPKTWSAPIRELALETYKKLNTAIAQQDSLGISLIARDPYKSEIPKLNSKHTHIWRFHKEVTPTRLISARIFQGNFMSTGPEPKSRLVLELLVRFDTEQSMEIYTHNRKPVHEPDPNYPQQGQGPYVAAKRKRVIEYLVLQNKLWDPQWIVKAQMWPKEGLKVTV